MRSRFLAAGTGVALIAAPTMLHRSTVAAILVSLTHASEAAPLADALLIVAPVALAIAAAGIMAMIAARRIIAPVAATASLVALVALPPVAGFAVFFCLLHSPQHFVGAQLAARRWHLARWLPVVVAVTCAAFTIVVHVDLIRAELAVPQRLTAAAFMALSILTVPHMLVPALLQRHEARAVGSR